LLYFPYSQLHVVQVSLDQGNPFSALTPVDGRQEPCKKTFQKKINKKNVKKRKKT